MELRDRIADILEPHLKQPTWKNPIYRGLPLADEILRIPEIAKALAAQMPDLPPERVGEIMREMGKR